MLQPASADKRADMSEP